MDTREKTLSSAPIKVNQMQPVVEEIISHGKKFNLGLEAGSKPELHAVIAVQAQSDSLIICNGYKDESYIELALLATEDGQAHLYRGRKAHRAGYHRKGSQKAQRKAKHRYPHQTGFFRFRQMG